MPPDSEAAMPRSRGSALIILAALMSTALAVTLVVGTADLSAARNLTIVHALLAVVFLAAAVRFSGAGLPLLVAFVFLNLSEVLVRQHGFPSLLQLLVLALAFAAWLKRGTAPLDDVLRQPVTILIAAYLLFSFVTTAFAVDRSIADARLIELTKASALYVLAVLLMRDAIRIRQALIAVAVAATLLSILPVVQVITADFSNEFGGLARIKQAHIYGRVFQPRIAGPVGDPNFFAQILLVAFPPMLMIGTVQPRRQMRLIWFAASAVVLLTIVLTYSRGAMLALAVVVVMLWKALHVSWRKTAVAGAVLLSGLLLLPTGVTERLLTIRQIIDTDDAPLHLDSSFEERKLYMQVAWVMFGANPVLGVGPGNYTARYSEYVDRASSSARQYEQTSDLYYPHNLPLELAAENGAVGTALFAAMLIAAWLALRPSRLRAETTLQAAAIGFRISLAGFLVSSLFLHLAFPRYLYLLLAFAASMGRISGPTEPQESESGHG